MDAIQTGCIVSLSYQYLILNFTRPEIVDHIFQYVLLRPVSVMTLTFSAGCIGQSWYVAAVDMLAAGLH